MTENEQRAAAVREALTWEKTPFVYGACVKGVGVDCGRFLAAVLNDSGVRRVDMANLPRLSPQWFMNRGDESYLAIVRQYATEYELAPGAAPQPGDLVVVKQGRDWAHSAMVVAWPSVVGAAYGYCVTVWRDIYTCPQFMNRPMKFFSPWPTR